MKVRGNVSKLDTLTSNCKFAAKISSCSKKDYSVESLKENKKDPKRDELTMSRMKDAEMRLEVRTRESCNPLG